MFQLFQKLRKYRIFASYSHDDKKIVAPLVAFLTPCYDVFYDKNSIGFGMKWQVVIEKSINECHGLFLFWCTHSSKSMYVKQEYEQALTLNKHIYPVLMDKTPLPKKLGVYQAVDFTEVVGSHKNKIISYPTEKTKKINTEKYPIIKPNLTLSALSAAQEQLNTKIVAQINKIVKKEFQTVIVKPKENFSSLVNRYVELENKNIVIGDVINPIGSQTKHEIIGEINFRYNVTDVNKGINNDINPNNLNLNNGFSGGKLDFT